MKKAKSGNTNAFGVLYELYAESIYRFIFLKTSNQEDTEDLVHQTFLKAWDHIPYYEERGIPFLSWLYSIARNTVIDFYRTRKATSELSETFQSKLVSSNELERLESHIALQGIKKYIAELGPIEQDALLLRYVEDLDHKAVASIIQKSESATKVLIHRAIAKLKHKLDAS
ncbi:MAG: RNA polymerase sigma factor [Patescibacteria group bacterium]|nr:RNA polymerase sigma factor [Patescibacteria group bacterium]MDE2438193.1 RNA polymerase sigma factor [Patescibacteria group bacterium]